jgi:hypothetical protein
VKPIKPDEVQAVLNSLANQCLYLHLETTNGAYAAHNSEHTMNVGAYIRNGQIQFERATIAGNGPYRVGLKMNIGWVYAEGLTDWEVDDLGRLLMAGHDAEGRLAVAFELSKTPFRV